MKNYITYIIALLFLVGCSDDFFDVNTPSNTKKIEDLTMNELLAPAIYHTVSAHYSVSKTLGNYSQYFTTQGGGAYGASSLDYAWKEIYLINLPNTFSIKDKATKNNSPKFGAVADILTAMNIGLATDCWGNIPYSEAAKDIQFPKPKFDTQESIYQEIDKLLSTAITTLESNNTDTEAINPKNDLIYKGDISKWIKLAYTLRARYKMHLSEVIGNSVASEALEYLEKGFNSNDDDFQLEYTSKNINPWYSSEILAEKTGNLHNKVGDQLVNYMNGRDYTFTNISIDPRLPVYASINDESNEWKGYVSGGEGKTYDGTNANTNFKDQGFYTNATAPIVLISYAEACFLKAEAEFLKNGGSPTSKGCSMKGYNAYLEGINTNMLKLGVSSSDYIVEESVAVGNDMLKLEHIMKEKYIANFLNPETFVDFRRYDFSQNVFKNLELQREATKPDYPFTNQWIVRINYPASEAQGNSENVITNKKSPVIPVWWDK